MRESCIMALKGRGEDAPACKAPIEGLGTTWKKKFERCSGGLNPDSFSLLWYASGSA